MSRVMIQPASYGDIGKAVRLAFKIFSPTIHGKNVLIKPNVLRAARPEEAITTHPALLGAVVGQVEALGASSIIVGDNPGVFGYGDNEASFEKSGLTAAARGYYRNIGNDSRPLPFNPVFMPTVSLSQAVLDADIIISLPKFKTHGLTVVSGAIKNSYGFLPGAQKATLHRLAGGAERFHELIVDVFRLRVPDLFIMDAVVGMEGNGPASPDLRDIGRVLASDNAVALDAVVARMMGCRPEALGFLRKAKELGLGDYDMESIDIIGEFFKIPDFKLPPLSGEANLYNADVQAVISRRMKQRPRVNREACTGCGSCVDQCPVSALSMGDGQYPSADAATCIACFCCQEICPDKAIVLQ